MLEGLILAGIIQASMDRLHGLPFSIVEQAVEVLPRRVPLRLSTEAGTEAIQVLAQSPQQRPSRAQRTGLQKKVQARFLRWWLHMQKTRPP